MDENTIFYAVKSNQEKVDFSELSDFLYKSGILEKFSFSLIDVDPVFYFRQDFLEYISKNGISSLFNFTISLEDITSKSMKVDEIESVILKFITQLNGAEKILIIDPYFYSTDSKSDLFEKSIKAISSKVQEIILVTSPRHVKNKADIDSKIKLLIPNIILNNITTDDIHDRFWIGIDKKKGVVIGTSFNGIGKKLALVDRISESDVNDIVKDIEKMTGTSLLK